MKKRGCINIGLLLILTVLLAGCSSGGSKTPVVKLDGSYELILGKSSIKEVQDAGFTNRYSHKKVMKVIPDSSWGYFYPMKDDLSFGIMLAGNKSSREIPLEEGVVFELSLDFNSPDYDLGEVLVDGVDYRGYTKEQLTEAMGEPTTKIEEYFIYESKNSSYTFIFKEGSETLTGLRVKDGTKQKYVTTHGTFITSSNDRLMPD